MRTVLTGLCLISLTVAVWARDTRSVTDDVLIKSTASWDGTPLPAYPQGRPEISILRITIPPHFRMPLHKHPVINAGVLLKGELTVVAEEGQTLHMKAGDSIVELVDKWHYGENEGDEPAEIIVFYAGVEGTPLAIEKK